MDKYARKLLDKQLRGIVPPRHDAVMILAIVAVFFAGMALGNAQFDHKSGPVQMASYSLVNAAPPAIPQ
jgi:hypothetical protein